MREHCLNSRVVQYKLYKQAVLAVAARGVGSDLRLFIEIPMIPYFLPPKMFKSDRKGESKRYPISSIHLTSSLIN